MLRIKLLDPAARVPVVAHPGEDLGYDLFALEGVVLAPRSTLDQSAADTVHDCFVLMRPSSNRIPLLRTYDSIMYPTSHYLRISS